MDIVDYLPMLPWEGPPMPRYMGLRWNLMRMTSEGSDMTKFKINLTEALPAGEYDVSITAVTPEPPEPPTPPTPPAEIYGAGANNTGQPVGGGQGYTGTPSGGTVVGTMAEISSAIKSGIKLLELADDAQVDLGKEFAIPAGVTLYGYRGINGKKGGLLYTNTTSTSKSFPSFLTMAKGARILGVRLRGPDTEESSSNNIMWHGIEMTATDCVVENCEIWGWPYAAIDSYVQGTSNKVRFNYLHHNRKTGYGYATEVGKGAFVLFECNRYAYNRHDICGVRGTPGTSYEARFNITEEYGKYTRFDCHGSDPGYPNQAGGGTILVHHNTDYNVTEPLFKTRGVPTDIIRCYRNLLPAGLSPKTAFMQTINGVTQTTFQKMEVFDNKYGDKVVP